jgi:predicted RNA binding protein YcfA (HicA-like mRNA interferase family)
MSAKLPAITGPELIALLVKDGWEVRRYATHGRTLTKYNENTGITLVTFIPTKTRPLPSGTLHSILGPKQTGLGRKGLLALIIKFSR